MIKYKIEITETLQKQISVEANSKSEAMGKVSQMYKNEDVILGSEDFVGTDIEIVPDEKDEV